jgi:hypothetical protein
MEITCGMWLMIAGGATIIRLSQREQLMIYEYFIFTISEVREGHGK